MERSMSELNNPMLDVVIDGKPERLKLAVEIDVSEQYNDERPYIEDEIVNARTTEGYFKYYDRVQKIKDKHSYKIISDEEYEEDMSELEAHKHDFF